MLECGGPLDHPLAWNLRREAFQSHQGQLANFWVEPSSQSLELVLPLVLVLPFVLILPFVLVLRLLLVLQSQSGVEVVHLIGELMFAINPTGPSWVGR